MIDHPGAVIDADAATPSERLAGPDKALPMVERIAIAMHRHHWRELDEEAYAALHRRDWSEWTGQARAALEAIRALSFDEQADALVSQSRHLERLFAEGRITRDHLTVVTVYAGNGQFVQDSFAGMIDAALHPAAP